MITIFNTKSHSFIFKCFTYLQKNIFKKNQLQHTFSSTKDQKPFIYINQSKMFWNFNSLGQKNSTVDCCLILNNDQINDPFLSKAIRNTTNILLADGGSNVFYEKGYRDASKIRGIVGDLDSVKNQTKLFYQQLKIPFVCDMDQNSNDYKKTMEYGIKLGMKNFIIFGAFGNRLDHTISVISISEQLMQKYEEVNILLVGKKSFMCILRGGYKHAISFSNDFERKGCGIVSFERVQKVKTSGFHWNLGEEYQFSTIEWRKFLSTSNQISDKESRVTIQFKDQLSFLSLVANFKD